MNDQNSSNEAKTPLANVSSGKVNSLKADWYHLDDNCLGHYDDDNGRDCRAIADIINPTTQDGASAAAQTQDVIDHSPAVPPDVYERLRNACNYTWGVGNESSSSISSKLAEDRRTVVWNAATSTV